MRWFLPRWLLVLVIAMVLLALASPWLPFNFGLPEIAIILLVVIPVWLLARLVGLIRARVRRQ